MSNVWLLKAGFTPAEVAVYDILQSLAEISRMKCVNVDEKGVARVFPSLQKLGEIMHKSERTVYSYIMSLVAKGILQKERRGNNKTNNYFVPPRGLKFVDNDTLAPIAGTQTAKAVTINQTAELDTAHNDGGVVSVRTSTNTSTTTLAEQTAQRAQEAKKQEENRAENSVAGNAKATADRKEISVPDRKFSSDNNNIRDNNNTIHSLSIHHNIDGMTEKEARQMVFDMLTRKYFDAAQAQADFADLAQDGLYGADILRVLEMGLSNVKTEASTKEMIQNLTIHMLRTLSHKIAGLDKAPRNRLAYTKTAVKNEAALRAINPLYGSALA